MAILTISIACMVMKPLIIRKGIERTLIWRFEGRKSSNGSGYIAILKSLTFFMGHPVQLYHFLLKFRIHLKKFKAELYPIVMLIV
jgi:hypothetical protein